MKKFMRIALVFALAGATLMYTGCTKDYSGDISDLNKKVSEQASALSALQTQVAAAQSSASEALSSAQNALKEAQAAAKAAEAANNDAEVAALTTKIATIEGNIADLQAKVEALNGLEEKLNEVADQLKKDVDAKVDAALEEIQAELDKALAQIDGAFTIKSVSGQANSVNYFWAKWNPGKTAAEKKNFDKVAEKFPELKDIKKDEVVASCNGVPFIVTPSTIEFNENDSFALVDLAGEDSGWELGAPYASPANVKAGTAGVWFVEVEAPAFTKTGDVDNNAKSNLALIVERAGGAIAQTSFDYEVQAINKTTPSTFTYTIDTIECSTDDFKDNTWEMEYIDKFNNGTEPVIYDEYFVIETTSKLDDEKYGVNVEGNTLTVANLPEKGDKDVTLKLKKTAILLDGKTATADITVKISAGAIAQNADLADSTIAVTLGYNAKASTGNYNVNVDIARGFGLNEVEWEVVYDALNGEEVLYAEYLDDDTDNKYNDNTIFADRQVTFLEKDGKTEANASDKVAYIRFTIKSDVAVPGKYSVKITDGSVFCAVGTIDVKNPAVKPVKIADKLCEDGVLQIVGTPANSEITYDLTQALILTTGAVNNTDFVFTDLAYEAATEETSDQIEEENWIADGETTFAIPTWNAKWGSNYTHNNEKEQRLLNTKREFAVEFQWFRNSKNTDTLHFWAQAVSPIWTANGSNITLNTDASKKGIVNTIYYVEEKDAAGKVTKPTSMELSSGQITGGKYVAGTKKGTEFKITGASAAVTTNSWKTTENAVWNLTDTTHVKFDDDIDNSNIVKFEEDNAKSTSYINGTDGLPVSVALLDAYEMGFLTVAEYMTRKEAKETWTYYLTVENWESIKDAYTTIVNYQYYYNGAAVLDSLATADPVPTPEVMKTKNSARIAAKKKALANNKQKQFDYFNTVISRIDFGTKKVKQFDYVGQKEAQPVGPEELETAPFFTFEGDKADYGTYANIGYDPTTKVVTAITAKTDNPSGRKTVVIPVYANVKDKWGMTTQKKVEITLKVE